MRRITYKHLIKKQYLNINIKIYKFNYLSLDNN